MTTGRHGFRRDHWLVTIDPSTRWGGAVTAFLRKPRLHFQDVARVDNSPYPMGPCNAHPTDGGECWYLSILGILHRWTGFTLYWPDKEARYDGSRR